MSTHPHSQTVLSTLATLKGGEVALRRNVPAPACREMTHAGVFIVGDIVLIPGLGVQARRSFRASPASRRD